MKKKNYRQDIQILRGISVLLVVFYHLKIPGFKNGFVGVDVFFVISGYLMAQLYHPNRKLDFFTRRAKRLLPAYLSTIFFTILIGFFTLIPSDFKQLLNQTKASLFFIPNLYFWSQDSYFTGTQFNPLLNLWSLGVEFQFYLIIPVIASVFMKSKKSLLFICLISIISCFAVLTISPKTSFFLLPLRLWEFLIGYLVFKYRRRNTLGNNLPLFYIIIIPFSILLLLNLPIDVYGTSIYLGHPGILVTIIVMLTAFVLTLNPPSKTRLWSIVFEKFGDYSYSIYLVHFPIIVLWNYQPFLGTKLGIVKINEVPILFLFILLSSVLMFTCIEVPFKKFRYDFKLIPIPFVILIAFSPSLESLHKENFSPKKVSISYAFQDRSEYRCGKVFRIFNPTARVCPINKGIQNTNVLLLGNSHADSIKETFIEVSKEYEVSAYFWVQNNPLMRGGAGIDEVYSEVKKKEISHVFLHYSSTALDILTLTNFLQKLSDENVSVTILGAVPVWSNSIPYLMWNQDKFIDELDRNYEDYFQDNFDELTSIRKLLNEQTQYLDIAALFCNPVCRYSNKDYEPYYWDSGHLTLTGSQLIKEPLNEIFDSFFG
jgi:peptidoglycan/LPS O-acetylase OafA/YrhL